LAPPQQPERKKIALTTSKKQTLLNITLSISGLEHGYRRLLHLTCPNQLHHILSSEAAKVKSDNGPDRFGEVKEGSTMTLPF
jgi:hypothetical protein